MSDRLLLAVNPNRLHEYLTHENARIVTTPDLVAHLRALPHAAQVEALRELLRAAPDAAVEAVDTAKVARAEWHERRYPLSHDPAQDYLEPDDDLLADGWALVTGRPRG